MNEKMSGHKNNQYQQSLQMENNNQLFGQLDCNFLISPIASIFRSSFKEVCGFEFQWLD